MHQHGPRVRGPRQGLDVPAAHGRHTPGCRVGEPPPLRVPGLSPHRRMRAYQSCTPRCRQVGSVAVLILVSLVAAACGDDDDNVTAAATTSAVTAGRNVDASGTIRIGLDVTNFNADPAMANSPTDQWMHQLITGTLLKQAMDGSFTPELAASADIV